MKPRPTLEQLAEEMNGNTAQAAAALHTAELLERLTAVAPKYPSLQVQLTHAAQALNNMLLLLLGAAHDRAATALELAECTAMLAQATQQIASLEQGQGASQCQPCDLWWAPRFHGPQVGEPCPRCGRPTVVFSSRSARPDPSLN